MDSTQFIILAIILNCILGGLFYWFSTSEARYGKSILLNLDSPECKCLRFYSYIFALLTLATIIFQV